MTVLLDTSVLIDHLRGDPAAGRALRDVLETDERVIGSTLTRTEVLAGARPAEMDRTLGLLSIVNWVPVTEELADRAGELAQIYLRSHSGIDLVDYVIAATVEHLGAVLWTRNIKHFPMVADLQPPY